MKTIFVFLASCFLVNVASADSGSDMIYVAKAVKAIIESGRSIPAVIAVEKMEQMSLPPQNCILVVYERHPNSECPNEPYQGPFMDKGFAACFKPSSSEVDHVVGVESQCPPKL